MGEKLGWVRSHGVKSTLPNTDRIYNYADVGMGWGAGWEKSWVEWDHMVSSQPYLTLTEFTIMQINIKFCTHSLYPLTGAIVNQAFHSIHWGSLALCYVDNHFKYRKSIF